QDPRSRHEVFHDEVAAVVDGVGAICPRDLDHRADCDFAVSPLHRAVDLAVAESLCAVRLKHTAGEQNHEEERAENAAAEAHARSYRVGYSACDRRTRMPR